MSTDIDTPVRINSLVWDTLDTHTTRTVIRTPQDLVPGPGMFVVESYNGYRTFARLTGRTRRFWGYACPTIERYEVVTTVIDGAIWGAPGDRIPGTYAIRPENVTQ